MYSRGQRFDLEKSILTSKSIFGTRNRHPYLHRIYHGPILSTKPPLKFPKKLWAYLITTISLYPPQHSLPLIMVQQGFTCLLKLLQPDLPSLLPIILPLGQRFPRHIILPFHLRFIEPRIVNPPTGRVNPSVRNSTQNDADGGNQ